MGCDLTVFFKSDNNWFIWEQKFNSSHLIILYTVIHLIDSCPKQEKRQADKNRCIHGVMQNSAKCYESELTNRSIFLSELNRYSLSSWSSIKSRQIKELDIAQALYK